MFVLEYPFHYAASETIACVVASERLAILIKSTKAVTRAGPNRTRAIDIHRIDNVVAETSRIVCFLSINLKLARHRIKAVQTISHAGQPQRAAGIFRDGPELAWTRNGAPVGPELFCFRIEPIKGVVAPDPQRSVDIDI